MHAGGRERVDSSNSGHLQRAARVPRVLAHIQHHGSQPVRRPVRQLCRRRPSARQRHAGSQQNRLRQPGPPQLHLDQPQDQLRQCPHRLPSPLPSGRLIY